MRAGLLILASGMSTLYALQEPPLPKWKADERKAYEAAGGVNQSLLLTEDLQLESPSDEPKIEVEKPKADEVTNDPVRTSDIPEQYLTAYFAEKPKEFLVDPQGLLGAKDFKDRLGFLNYHAGDSSIDFYIYVFGGEQEIPGEARAEETVERLYTTGRPAAVVFYFVGAPQRSVIYLSPSLTEGVPAAEQRRALQSSVMSAFEKLNFAEQLEAFSVQMSIRIYWMERMLGGHPAPDEIPAFTRKKEPMELAPSVLDEWKLKISGWFEQWWGFGAIIAGGLMLLSAFAAWMRSRVRLRFPDLDVEPRLGGAHAAGVGAVISFASASLPPASQKDQVPDYLRRA
jgi:hypothetical protein